MLFEASLGLYLVCGFAALLDSAYRDSHDYHDWKGVPLSTWEDRNYVLHRHAGGGQFIHTIDIAYKQSYIHTTNALSGLLNSNVYVDESSNRGNVHVIELRMPASPCI